MLTMPFLVRDQEHHYQGQTLESMLQALKMLMSLCMMTLVLVHTGDVLLVSNCSCVALTVS